MDYFEISQKKRKTEPIIALFSNTDSEYQTDLKNTRLIYRHPLKLPTPTHHYMKIKEQHFKLISQSVSKIAQM